MSNVRIYFENGIPDKEIVRKWTEEFSCFHSCEVVIRKETDNKTMFVEFENSYSDIVWQWEQFFKTSKATYISLFSYPDLGDGEGYVEYQSDNVVSYCFSCTKNIKSYGDFLYNYRMTKRLGFGSEFRRFNYCSIDTNKLEIIVDNRIGNFYDDLIEEEMKNPAYKQGKNK